MQNDIYLYSLKVALVVMFLGIMSQGCLIFVSTPKEPQIPTMAPNVTSAHDNVYYVSPDGNDSNPGTQLQPWRTIQKAANTVVAGDTVTIGAGQYNENVTITLSGTITSPIIFRGQAAPNIVKSSPTNTACLDSRNSCILGTITIDGSQVVFRNMEVSGSPVKPGEIAGINVSGSNDEVSNNFIHNTWGEGISLRSSSSNNRVFNNHIMYAVVSAIYFDGQNHLIEGNTITHSVTRPPDGIALSRYSDSDGIRFFGSGTMVRGNTIKDIYLDESPESDDPHSDCFQSWKNANNMTFERNYCELENSTAYLDPMVKFFMIERSSSTSYTVSNIKIINNIFVSKSTSTRWTPIQIGNDACSASYPLQNFMVANNTFIHTGNTVGHFAILLRCADTVTIRNNAIYNFASSRYPYIYQDKSNNLNVTISNNSIYNSNGDLPMGGAYPGDNIASTWMKNPLFININGGDYHLQSNSPLIDAGYGLGNLITNDFEGVTRPQRAGYDIGAYELRVP